MTTHPGIDLPTVRSALVAAGIDVAGPLSAELIVGGRSNLTYRLTDGEHRWVLRRPPLAGLTPGAHDVAREHRVMSGVARAGVPVPEPVLLCTDVDLMGAPFTVVAYVDGRTVRTQEELAALDDAEVAAAGTALIQVLAALHAVDPADVGLAEFGRPGYVTRQVGLWRRQWDLISAEPSPDVERLHASLAARIPSERPLAVVHGDFRIDNALLDLHCAGRVRAVVDWELSALGDTRADLAMTCIYRHPAFDHVVGEAAAATSDRFESVDDMAERYAVTTGDDLGDWAFYRALAAFKLAVIVEGIRHRRTPGPVTRPRPRAWPRPCRSSSLRACPC